MAKVVGSSDISSSGNYLEAHYEISKSALSQVKQSNQANLFLAAFSFDLSVAEHSLIFDDLCECL